MVVIKANPTFKPPGDDGAPPAGSDGRRPRCLLVTLHAPSANPAGAKVEIETPLFKIGEDSDDLTVEGATKAQTYANIVWSDDRASGIKPGWRLQGSGRLWVNGRATTDHALTSGDELRVVDSFFRFLFGTKAEEKYYEAIYHITILDIPSGAYNQRYLREMLHREKERATRRDKGFSVAVVSVRPEPNNQESGHDLLRPVVKGLGDRTAADHVIARTGAYEFAVVGPQTASALEEYLKSKLPRILPGRVQAHLGVIQYQPDLDTEEIVPKAREKAVRLDA